MYAKHLSLEYYFHILLNYVFVVQNELYTLYACHKVFCLKKIEYLRTILRLFFFQGYWEFWEKSLYNEKGVFLSKLSITLQWYVFVAFRIGKSGNVYMYSVFLMQWNLLPKKNQKKEEVKKI